MADDDDSAEKSFEATQRKLQQARRKGEIPRSQDLLTAMAYFGLLLAAITFGGEALRSLGEVLLPLIEQPDRLNDLFFRDGASPAVGGLMLAALTPLAPLFLTPAVLVLLTLFAMRGLIFTGTKLQPKLNRLSIIENAKNKFGRRGLFDFFKSFVKLMVYSLILALFLSRQMTEIVGILRGAPAGVVLMMTDKMVGLLMQVVLIAAVIGGIDYFWQRSEHLRRNRMSQKEMRDEFKESEGDPYLKQSRRMRGQEIAMGQMMQDVPGADVIIVNPTHYAVALTWSRLPGEAPTCVAKGQDAVAARIREIAQENNVPIHSDPPTARALFATVEIGEEIEPEHYRAVAAAIRFAEAMRAKARKRGWG